MAEFFQVAKAKKATAASKTPTGTALRSLGGFTTKKFTFIPEKGSSEQEVFHTKYGIVFVGIVLEGERLVIVKTFKLESGDVTSKVCYPLNERTRWTEAFLTAEGRTTLTVEILGTDNKVHIERYEVPTRMLDEVYCPPKPTVKKDSDPVKAKAPLKVKAKAPLKVKA